MEVELWFEKYKDCANNILSYITNEDYKKYGSTTSVDELIDLSSLRLTCFSLYKTVTENIWVQRFKDTQETAWFFGFDLQSDKQYSCSRGKQFDRIGKVIPKFIFVKTSPSDCYSADRDSKRHKGTCVQTTPNYYSKAFSEDVLALTRKLSTYKNLNRGIWKGLTVVFNDFNFIEDINLSVSLCDISNIPFENIETLRLEKTSGGDLCHEEETYRRGQDIRNQAVTKNFPCVFAYTSQADVLKTAYVLFGVGVGGSRVDLTDFQNLKSIEFNFMPRWRYACIPKFVDRLAIDKGVISFDLIKGEFLSLISIELLSWFKNPYAFIDYYVQKKYVACGGINVSHLTTFNRCISDSRYTSNLEHVKATIIDLIVRRLNAFRHEISIPEFCKGKHVWHYPTNDKMFLATAFANLLDSMFPWFHGEEKCPFSNMYDRVVLNHDLFVDQQQYHKKTENIPYCSTKLDLNHPCMVSRRNFINRENALGKCLLSVFYPDVDLVEICLRNGADYRWRDDDGNTIFHLTCATRSVDTHKEDRDIFKTWINRYGKNIFYEKNYRGETPIIYALRNRNGVGIIEHILVDLVDPAMALDGLRIDFFNSESVSMVKTLLYLRMVSLLERIILFSSEENALRFASQIDNWGEELKSFSTFIEYYGPPHTSIDPTFSSMDIQSFFQRFSK